MSGSTSFGEWFRQRRNALRLSREQLAVRAACSAPMIRRIEEGVRRPSLEMARALAAALQVPETEVPAFIEFARHGVRREEEVMVAAGGVLSPPPRHTAPSNLPAWRTSFVGRADEVAAVQDLLARAEVRLVTLLGAPGIGKSRLGLQVASRVRDQFPDGIFSVALFSLTEPIQVAPAIARALDLKEASGRPIVELLQDYLQHKKLLLLLDNFEHVAAANTLVSSLIDTCPDLKLLVTSRTALYIYGECQFPVPPLGIPDADAPVALDALMHCEAVSLFAQRAQAIRPLFLLTAQTTPVVAEICRQLDGLPLAIELAAARIKLWTPSEILGRLTHRLALLTAGPSDLPARQRTLRAAIEWSYDLLDPADRQLFRRLAVFMRGATLEAITAVCYLPGDPAVDPASGVASLLDKSLLNSELQPDGTTRYWMLWTIRDYGLARLSEAGEEDAIRRQHAIYYLELAETAEPYLRSARRDPWLGRLDLELSNLRGALTWCLAAPERADWGLQLAGALHWFWYFRGYLTEGLTWLEQSLELSGIGRTAPAYAKALDAAGRLALLHGTYGRVLERLEESVRIWRAVGPSSGLAYSLMTLGIAIIYRTRDPDAGGQQLISEAIAWFQQAQDRWGLANALDLMGDATYLLNHPEQQTVDYKAASLAIYRDLGDQLGVGHELNELGNSALRQGDYAKAHAYLTEALAIEEAQGDRWVAAYSLRSLGDVAWHQGAYAEAEQYYEESLQRFRVLGDQLGVSGALRNLAYLHCIRGDYDEAAGLHRQALTLAYDQGNSPTVALSLAGLAGLALARGRLLHAAQLFGAAEVIRETSRGQVPPFDQVVHQQNEATLRQLMDPAAFVAAWAQGRAWSVDQAVAHAYSDHTNWIGA